ncbi:MAG: hypothetical protein AVDCRST_MAG35-3126, partial [uncultured Quadrisphaera sp.]
APHDQHLREITPRATWDETGAEVRLDRITRIDVGGRYEQALSDVAAGTYEPPLH